MTKSNQKERSDWLWPNGVLNSYKPKAKQGKSLVFVIIFQLCIWYTKPLAKLYEHRFIHQYISNQIQKRDQNINSAGKTCFPFGATFNEEGELPKLSSSPPIA